MIYKPALSPYWWVRCARHGQKALCESTKVPWDGATADQREKNRRLALDIYHARMGDLARQRYELPGDATAPAAPETLRSWIAWYREHVTSTHRGAEREQETLARLDAALGALQLTAITRARVTEWMTARAKAVVRGRPISASTINREVDVLKALLRSAADHGKLEASPIAGMARLHTATPKRRLMTRDEEARLLKAIKRPDDKALLIMALDTLCRLGDCLDLRRADDAKTSLWIGDPKTGTGYQVPVTTRLRTALDAIPASGPDTDHYFALRRRPATEAARRASVSHMLRRACEAADPPIPYGRLTGGISWHWATRRTAATRMLLAGVPLPTVQRAGHWQGPEMVLGIYAESDDPAVRAAVEAIGPPKPPQEKKKKGKTRPKKAKRGRKATSRTRARR